MGRHSRPAVVVNVGWVPGISTIQSLGRAGIPVHAVDHRPEALGFRSRYVTQAHVSPRRLVDESGFVDFLERLGDELGGGVPIFPVDDDDLDVIARARERLGERFAYPFPELPVLEQIQDKGRQVARARDLGVPVPRASPGPTDSLGYPVFVKPARTGDFRRRFGTKGFRCESRRELDDAWKRAKGFDPRVWEWIPGGDETLWTLGSVLRRDGEALGLFTGRKLLQDPPLTGTARVAEARWSEEVAELGLTLLRGLGVHGPSQVELKRDPRDGVLKLIEVNPRLYQWHSLAEACGVNLAALAYLDLVGASPERARMEGDGKRWAITFKVGKPRTVQPLRYVDPLLQRDDPKIALAHLRYVVGKRRA